METFLQDVRFGLRMMLKNPGFTAIAIITMALGLGANTAVFSVVNGVMLKLMPFKDPDRLIFALETNTKFPPPGISASTLNYRDWKVQSKSWPSTPGWFSLRFDEIMFFVITLFCRKTLHRSFR